MFFCSKTIGIVLIEIKRNYLFHTQHNYQNHGLKPLDNIGKTEKQKCSQIYT